MNNIFQKNLAALEYKNAILAERLKTYIPNEIPQLVQNNGNYNLLYKGSTIHNEESPLGEAKEIFSMATNEPVAIHVIFGLGLGYLFQVATLNSNGSVILYEPDLNIIWLAFTLVDFSNDILKNNVFITSTLDELANAIYQKSGMKNNPQLLSIPSQRKYDQNGFNELVKKLQDIVGSFALDLKYTQQNFYPAIKMSIKNLNNIINNEKPLAVFKNAYKGKTAVIVSAGPTLDRNIETLKKYRNKFVLFTVGTALKTLYANGLKPDFLCIIEAYNSSKQVEGLDLSNVNFITEPYSNAVMRKYKFKNIYTHLSSNMPTNSLIGEILNQDIDEYLSKGTVSYTALNCARLLGCSKIVLVGQDLAYIEGHCYSKDSAYKDLICAYNEDSEKWEIMAKDFEAFAAAISPSADTKVREATAKRRLSNLNKSLYYVKGINGDMIPTESVYAAFVEPLKEYTQIFKGINYINTSLVGAQIDGFTNLPLEDALKDSEPVGDLELKTNFEYNKNEIIINLKKKLTELKSIIPTLEESMRWSKSLKNDLKRYKNTNEEVLKGLKKLSVNYLSVTGDFANKSKLFDYITVASKLDLDYEMKITKEFNYETVSSLNEKFSAFYINADKRIKEIEGFINESINSAS